MEVHPHVSVQMFNYDVVPQERLFKAGVYNVTSSATLNNRQDLSKVPHSNMHIPPIGWSFPVKSLSVRSRASNASLFVMGASSTTVALPSCITLLSAVPFLMLQMGMSVACKSRGILKVLSG